MKKITSINAAVIATIVLFSSCKKDNTVVAEPQVKKLIKMEQTGSSIPARTYSYNAQGRLTEVKNNIFTNQFDFSTALFQQTTLNTSSSLKTYEARSTASGSGKVTSLDNKSFKADGSLNYTELNTYQYDAAGYLTNRSYGGYNFVNEYINGNLTKSTGTSSGAPFVTETYEYYTDKTDKFNLNWLEHMYQEQYLNDKELFGKKNKNLVKKAIYDYATGSDYTYDFVYSFDADGYVTDCTATEKTNGTTSAVYTYKFFYQ